MMPAYNVARYLPVAIQSVLRQDFRNFELIIVDDCSADGTFQAAAFFLSDSRVRVYRNQRRLGDALTRNRILRMSRGRYIAPFDADDIMLQGRLRKQYEFLEAHKEFGAAFGKALIVNERMDRILGKLYPLTQKKDPLNRSGRVSSLEVGFNQGTMLVRKNLMLSAGGYEESFTLGVDSRLSRRIFEKTRFYFLNYFCFVYRIRREGKCQHFFRLKKQQLRYLFYTKKKRNSERFWLKVGRWGIEATSNSRNFTRAVQWRLNFHLIGEEGFLAEPDRKIRIRFNADSLACQSDRQHFELGFLRPLAAELCRRAVFIANGALFSKRGDGIFIFSENPSLKAKVALSFLKNDFWYHSSSYPWLSFQNGKVKGENFVDAITLGNPLEPDFRAKDIWGKFWNPILKKYCINPFLYRTYLTGTECDVTKVIVLKKVGGKRLVFQRTTPSRLRALLGTEGGIGYYLPVEAREAFCQKISERCEAWEVHLPRGKIEFFPQRVHERWFRNNNPKGKIQ